MVFAAAAAAWNDFVVIVRASKTDKIMVRYGIDYASVAFVITLAILVKIKVVCCGACACGVQCRLETHVRNVGLFDELLQTEVNWLSDNETRLMTLRCSSKVVDRVHHQLDTIQVTIAMHSRLAGWQWQRIVV